MDSSIVIKVKYGETLRRFNALIVDEELALDLNELREKVLSLFNFHSDSELTLTYIDEDGDVVTLADEEDLRDIMRQSLNPLRLSVRLNTERIGGSYSRSSGSSTPMRSPRVHPPFQNLNGSVSEILKSVPEAIRETLSRLSTELGSNDTSSPPGYAELLDSLSKMGLTYLKEIAVSGTKSGSSGSSTDPPMSEDKNSSKVDELTSVTELRRNEADQGNLTGFSKGFITPAADLVDLNAAPRGENFSVGSSSSNPALSSSDVPGLHGPFKKVQVKKFGEYDARENYNSSFAQGDKVATNTQSDDMVATNSQSDDKMKEVKKSNESHMGWNYLNPDTKDVKKSNESHMGWNYLNPGTLDSYLNPDKMKEVKKSNESHIGWNYLNPCTPDSLASDQGGVTGTKVAAVDSGNFLGSRSGLNSFIECPFAGVPLENYSSSVPGRPYAPRVAPFKRSYNHGDGIKSIFHRGVCCDGCGVHPITGPRFKSKVKENYDLCSICFADMGNDAEYIRMDHPLSYRHPASLKGFYDPVQHCRGRPPTLPQVLRGSARRSKLDSCFIQDVSIRDGTLMAPSTPFTKIWRLRNNGNIVWPRGTQLLWIGGDRFSKTFSVELELPADGCPVDKEIDIAVEFNAPEQHGRYISYWRMASPSGQKFGQRVWVLIQVDDSMKDSFRENVHGFNLNLLPFSGGVIGSQFENASVGPIGEDSLSELDNSNSRATELVEPVVNAPSNKDQELNFPINDTLLVGGALSNPAPVEASSAVANPTVDFPVVAPNAANTATSSTEDVSGGDEVEEILLKELDGMGFKHVDLNKEILRRNEYNLEQSVDDLCAVAEWDPILEEELQEMGFADKEMNKMLLKKNNGSIKRVVMDLIGGEKA